MAEEGVRPRAAVLGMPIAHSLSPVLHRAAYRALGLDWAYTAIACDEVALPGLIARVRAEPGWVGLSLTMPLKTAVLTMLDTLDGPAESLGAVNTVVVADDGADGTGADGTGTVRLAGFNTDVAGIAYAVGEVLGAGVVPRRPLVLGAGGTARAALGALARLGATNLDLFARRVGAAAPMVDLGAALGVTVTVHPWRSPDPMGGPGDVMTAVGAADVVLATTPAGATDDLARLPWPASTGLVELLYHPWPTPLAAAADVSGARVAGGLVVLAAQAVGQVRLFTGAEVEVGLLLEAGRQALEAREGRSGAGKRSGAAGKRSGAGKQ